MIRKITHFTDSQLTQDLARRLLPGSRMVVGWYTNKENKYSVVHSHPYYELILPMCGEVLYSCNGSLYHLHTGELIVFPDEVFHMGRYDVTKEVSERLLLQVDSSFWHETANMLGMPDFLGAPSPVVFNAHVVSAWDIRGLFIRISKNQYMAQKQRDAIFRSQISELMLILSAGLTDENIVAADATSALVDKAMRFMQQHYTDPQFSVNLLADYLYVSRSHVSRVFREYTTESIHGYLTGLRLQRFKTALGEGRSILDACTESGFSDYSSFLKTFRKTYGITPNEYRKRLFQTPDQLPIEGMTMLDTDLLPAMVSRQER